MSSFLSYSLSLILALTVVSSSYGQEEFGIMESSSNALGGLMQGEDAPDFSAVDQNGKEFILSQELSQGPVLVVFYRGFWCGYCNSHLAELESELEQLTKRGIQVVAITPEQSENVDKTIEKTQTSIKIIVDKGGEIMKDYQVFFEVTPAYQEKVKKHTDFFLVDLNGQDTATLPVPATYLITQEQKVSYVHYDPDYSKRSSVKDILYYLE